MRNKKGFAPLWGFMFAVIVGAVVLVLAISAAVYIYYYKGMGIVEFFKYLIKNLLGLR